MTAGAAMTRHRFRHDLDAPIAVAHMVAPVIALNIAILLKNFFM